MGYYGRDVEVVSINEKQCLVAACDSCGAIGMKDLDEYKISWFITGKLTARVALLEVLSTGAVPQMLTAVIANEPSPTGEELLEGVKNELTLAGLETLPMVISTEKNMPTRQTGFGVSVIGVAEKEELRIGTSQLGDYVYCLGLPKVGAELTDPEDPEIINVKAFRALLDYRSVHDIIPVGSRGIQLEAEQLAASVQTQFQGDPDCVLDLGKSAGPSTCLIFSSYEIIDEKDISSFGLLLTKIGQLIRN
ncbi:hypothetical protein Desor_2772 [Desulfosporosinus orientis DSM 765]|uniref:Alpha-ribazole kinase n=1 Tax=Desulfosporosinus orientis (strain ATCC 19365 / DSM 765 / NCIMB 8382 / VKM B-1628 / Singapore I) TaxID=768706 RepID=G7WBI3_DESOD|nr:hypothetical protein [Desulfosporosinus orientis]AET68312.1 hypothetical protein Desor_2772 [Desulfosporosinus orientis DSM 765]